MVVLDTPDEIKRILFRKSKGNTEQTDEVHNIVFSGKDTTMNAIYLNLSGRGEDWKEYKILYAIPKVDTIAGLSDVFTKAEKIIKSFSPLPVDSVGIQEVSCCDEDNYYVLLYLILDDFIYD